MHIEVEETAVGPVRLFRINTGSCNGCDVELAVTSAVTEFDVEQLGCRYTESAHEADIVLITGPLTIRARDEVLRLYAQAPRDKVTVAVGVCPVSGGVFRDSYAVDGPIERHLPVDVNIPGCPPRPQALLAGIGAALEIRRARRDGEEPARNPDHRKHHGTDNFPARGRMSYDAKACVDCRMCRHVCAAGAIRFEAGDGGVRLTLWHNSCVFCGLCSHYCPTGALSVTGDWRLDHRAADAFTQIERGEVPYAPCTGCGEAIIPTAPQLLHAAFRRPNPEIEKLKNLCPACRQLMSIGVPRR
ncbi:4Fe-4S dicluster domain-containing protein [Geomonas sp. Red69]|nr:MULTISPECIES: 4Fe-4S dicluster domain-containing protein [Geomonas]MBU5635333.1 4Fe-4S dicluster domain-containing protein [Geomonas diazotrophica]QXE86752.1 4Fe-4S dicluster domain-containing protein [Geomonas nitrogeniifigens]